jgi:hypothetical protein
MSTGGVQAHLFQSIKTHLTATVSLVDEVAGVLGLSTDSAYRRIRGEKELSLEETRMLCTRYGLSMDALWQETNGTISFGGRFVNPLSFDFKEYLSEVGRQLGYMASFQQRELYYLCKDIPLFHHYHFKPLAAFKYFFWHKTILGSPDFVDKKVRLSHYPDSVFALGREALAAYNQMTAYEIWNMESLNSTLRQVEFYHDTAAFLHTEDLLHVYEALEGLFVHLEKQAELGYQFKSGDPEQKRLGGFHLYFNEVMTGDNSILSVLDGVKLAFIAHSGINFMLTRDVDFCENLHRYHQKLMSKSTLISQVSERERAAFFYELHQRIDARKKVLYA